MRTSILLIGLSVALVAEPATSLAQGGREGLAIRLAPGVGLAGASFGDENPESDSEFGFTLGGELVLAASGSIGIAFTATWHSMGVANPHFDEVLKAIYIEAGPEFAIGRMFLRPTLGLALQTWSGSMAPGTGTALSAGLAFGRELPVGKSVHIAPELVLLGSSSSGLTTFLAALQLPIGWRTSPEDN